MEKEALPRLTALGHEHRMAVFRLLVRRYPDSVPAGEIAAALALKPNTLSAHLSALKAAGLIAQTRQGTSLRYCVDWAGVNGLVDFLLQDCCRGRPDLCRPAHITALTEPLERPARKLDVLFVCSGNSARSIFAESILRHEAGDRFNAWSAGTSPHQEPNPSALALLKSNGHDIAPLRTKNIAEFQTPDAPALDFVFTVCDRAANEECASWEGQPICAHWGIADPVGADGSDANRRLAFQQAYDRLHDCIRAFAALPFDALDRASLQRCIDEIARQQEEPA